MFVKARTENVFDKVYIKKSTIICFNFVCPVEYLSERSVAESLTPALISNFHVVAKAISLSYFANISSATAGGSDASQSRSWRWMPLVELLTEEGERPIPKVGSLLI